MTMYDNFDGGNHSSFTSKYAKENIAMLQEKELFVIDFSVIANDKKLTETLGIIEFLRKNQKKVAVTQEFYRNYDIVTMCSHEEQIRSSELTKQVLSELKAENCLGMLSEFLSPCDAVVTFGKNPKVCFICYEYSELCEAIHKDIQKNAFKASFILLNDENNFEFVDNTAGGMTSLGRKAVDPVSSESSFYNSGFEAKEGAVTKLKDGHIIKLGKFLGKGGEGAVYHVDDDGTYKNFVVKIYHKKELNKLRMKKMSLMETKPILFDGVCWPSRVVYSEKGIPVGFIMPFAKGKSLAKILGSVEFMEKSFPKWTRIDLVNLAIDVLQKIQYLHLYGILVGDIRDKNIVIGDDGKACVVDIDSSQIGNLACPKGYPDYTPPEFQGVEFKSVLRTYEGEAFAAAVIMFKILFRGIHPYDQKFGADNLEDDIRQLRFPYPLHDTGDFSKIPWGGYDELWKRTPIQFRQFLIDIFLNNKRYSIHEMVFMLQGFKFFLEKENKPELNKIYFVEK